MPALGVAAWAGGDRRADPGPGGWAAPSPWRAPRPLVAAVPARPPTRTATGLLLAFVALAASAVAAGAPGDAQPGRRPRPTAAQPVTAVLSVSSDPRLRSGPVRRLRGVPRSGARRSRPPARRSSWRHRCWSSRDRSWAEVRLGSLVRVPGRLAAAEGQDLSARAPALGARRSCSRGRPRGGAPPTGCGPSLQASVTGVPEDQRPLVPGPRGGRRRGPRPAAGRTTSPRRG